MTLYQQGGSLINFGAGKMGVRSPTLVNTFAGQINNSDTLTLPVTIGNGPDRVLDIIAMVDDATDSPTLSATVGGSSASLIVKQAGVSPANASRPTISRFRFIAPPSGALDVVISSDSVVDTIGVIVNELNKTHQTTPVRTFSAGANVEEPTAPNNFDIDLQFSSLGSSRNDLMTSAVLFRAAVAAAVNLAYGGELGAREPTFASAMRGLIINKRVNGAESCGCVLDYTSGNVVDWCFAQVAFAPS